MLQSIEVRLRPHLEDCVGKNVAKNITENLGFPINKVLQSKVFIVDELSKEDMEKALHVAALHDPVLHDASSTPFASDADWILEVSYRPGVTDNEGRTARDTLALVAGKRRDFHVYTAVQHHIYADLSREQVESIAKNLLANELIQRFRIKSKQEWAKEPGFPLQAAQVTGEVNNHVALIPLSTMSDDELIKLSRENTLALSLDEMRVIKEFFSRADVHAERAKVSLPKEPTDAELEVLAQTWSEHCKHKIFSSHITYTDTTTGKTEIINSLYKTYIQNPTKVLREQMGEDDFCRSVFKDNAGVVSFNETHDVCIKVETHNSPSALDPYGGALTGIVGVNRDPMGTGLGAELVCNTDVFCFASPFHKEELPPRLLHPRRVMEGVRLGVEDGGNKSGIPTVNGSVVFDERFLGKPLVYCGTVGMIPRTIAGRPGHMKKANVGDIVVMAGGRIGKDGIHGATFSSEELHEGSPATAVQIGDPITQRKLYDFTIRVRNLGLYSAITDNGAGGLSSSIGEMAEDTNGCLIDLSKALLKYDGLRPWEIFLSEAQERMTYAVPKENLEEFLRIAKDLDVEATPLGEFTDTGYLHVLYQETPVAYIPMEFLHGGLPQMQLNAVWEGPYKTTQGKSDLLHGGQVTSLDKEVTTQGIDQSKLLSSMLGRLNICSKEYLIRQYDHEVKGGSVVKPLVGILRDGPADAAVIRPLLGKKEGIVLSHGICPKFSDADTYWMMANAIDEAVRNAIAVGADPNHMAGVDNFCWCDPVKSEKTPDGEYKLAQLVRANKALADFCLGFGVPCISGKDSMKNDYTGGGAKISIPPTVLFSLLGHMPDVSLALTSDFKAEGHAIYILGTTHAELSGSEIAEELGLKGGVVPQVDLLSARLRYTTLHEAVKKKLISACHDLSDGGFSVALAEMAIGGRLGASVNIEALPTLGIHGITEVLYAESASRLLVTVAPENEEAFKALFANDSTCARIGNVTGSSALSIMSGDTVISKNDVHELTNAFKGTLNW